MTARYNAEMISHQTLPALWLLSDARNDDRLETALASLPHGSGFVFRHYHLDAGERRQRFEQLARIARSAGHLIILSADADTAREWGADGIYGPADQMTAQDAPFRLASVHDESEIRCANQNRVDGVFLSPVLPTRSHPGGSCLGNAGFHKLAALANCPVIALGGMTAARAKQLGWPRWAAIDGLSG